MAIALVGQVGAGSATGPSTHTVTLSADVPISDPTQTYLLLILGVGQVTAGSVVGRAGGVTGGPPRRSSSNYQGGCYDRLATDENDWFVFSSTSFSHDSLVDDNVFTDDLYSMFGFAVGAYMIHPYLAGDEIQIDFFGTGLVAAQSKAMLLVGVKSNDYPGSGGVTTLFNAVHDWHQHQGSDYTGTDDCDGGHNTNVLTVTDTEAGIILGSSWCQGVLKDEFVTSLISTGITAHDPVAPTWGLDELAYFSGASQFTGAGGTVDYTWRFCYGYDLIAGAVGAIDCSTQWDCPGSTTIGIHTVYRRYNDLSSSFQTGRVGDGPQLTPCPRAPRFNTVLRIADDSGAGAAPALAPGPRFHSRIPLLKQ